MGCSVGSGRGAKCRGVFKEAALSGIATLGVRKSSWLGCTAIAPCPSCIQPSSLLYQRSTKATYMPTPNLPSHRQYILQIPILQLQRFRVGLKRREVAAERP